MTNPIYTSFLEYIVDQFPNLHFAYATREEMKQHFMSGEVQMPTADAVKYAERWAMYVRDNGLLYNNVGNSPVLPRPQIISDQPFVK